MTTSIAQDILQEVFGYPRFRGAQQTVIDHVIANGDALVLMPTGGGKSLCYQIPAIARFRQGLGTCIVISPLIALMHDQVGALDIAGVNAAFLNSSQNAAESRYVEQQLLQGQLVLLYVAPERLTTPRFLAILEALHEKRQLSVFAIDEAHCVSQWGHDFRPEYRSLSLLAERFAGVPRIALTATADSITRADIIERLQLEQAHCFISSFDRPNIRYHVASKTEARKQLLHFLRTEHVDDAGIVYCQSRKKVEETALWLTQEGFHALPYHAGLDIKNRTLHQNRFLREDSLIIVATIAFGMGIDKPNVRFVAHLDLPKNIESYYQETGRAGRDGDNANAWMTYGLQDVVNQRRMIDESVGSEAFKQSLRGKLDALLALAEATDCRRVRLLQYFDEASAACGNCDNCLNPPAIWDASVAAQQLLSCIYRIEKHSNLSFGAGHLIDVLRGKLNDKVQQFGHGSLSTFGIGATLSEQQWRSILRQLVATGAVRVDATAFNTLKLTESARGILKGEVPIHLRAEHKASGKKTTVKNVTARSNLDDDSVDCLKTLKAWRSATAAKNNLPAYLIFHDSTLTALAETMPQSLKELSAIAGIGIKKLEAYGADLLQILQV